ncbi:MAG: acyltransferase [Acidobacteriia bacterium]|nr:acyltransferase [Terriglobia bacterium]
MQRRLGTIDGLRGLAAFSVAWFHFTNGGTLLPDGWLKASGHYGWVGVEMFFVISGFIIPYSLYRSGYRSSDFGFFLIKRIARLDPPYFADILLVIALSYLVALAPGFHGEWPHYTWTQLLCHVGYINSIVGKPWVNVVFWSLGIEFQYYVTIGVLFPLLVNRRRTVRFGFLAVLMLAAILVRHSSLVFCWFPLFAAGILTFQRKVNLISTRTLLAGLAATGAVCWFLHGHLISIVVVATALTIQFVHIPTSRLTNLGLISYSLYLLHVPIGGKIVNIGTRFAHTLPAQVLVLAAAVAGSIFASILLYRLVELPSQRLSSSIRYRSSHAEPESAPALLVAERLSNPTDVMPHATVQ